MRLSKWHEGHAQVWVEYSQAYEGLVSKLLCGCMLSLAFGSWKNLFAWNVTVYVLLLVVCGFELYSLVAAPLLYVGHR